MEFAVMRRDPKQGVLVSTHPDFSSALTQRDKLGPGHEVVVLDAAARQKSTEVTKKRQKAAR